MTTKIEKLQKQISKLTNELRQVQKEEYIKNVLPELRKKWQGKCFLNENEYYLRYFKVIAIDDEKDINVLIIINHADQGQHWLEIKMDVVSPNDLTESYTYNLGYKCHEIPHQEFTDVFEEAVNQMCAKIGTK
jgi:hypothetical protein